MCLLNGDIYGVLLNFLQLSFLWNYYCHCLKGWWLLFLSLGLMLLSSLPTYVGGQLCWLLLDHFILQQALASSAEVYVNIWAVHTKSALAYSTSTVLLIQSNTIYTQWAPSRSFSRLWLVLPQLSNHVLLLLQHEHLAVQLSFELGVDDPQVIRLHNLSNFNIISFLQILELVLKYLDLFRIFLLSILQFGYLLDFCCQLNL
jgi:hypothetical protein